LVATGVAVGAARRRLRSARRVEKYDKQVLNDLGCLSKRRGRSLRANSPNKHTKAGPVLHESFADHV